MHIRKTNIVATIGPASCDPATLEEMMLAGMDVARLNFSHGTYEEYEKVIFSIRELSKKLNKTMAIIQDLSGPKIRLGEFADGKIVLKQGAPFTLTTEEYQGDENKVFINYPRLPSMVSAGTVIMLDDGKRKLEVVSTDEKNIYCTIKEGGEIIGRRGVNIIGRHLKFECLTEKDIRDIDFGVEKGVDFVALSFVQTAEDVRKLRDILESKHSHAAIISKIETDDALHNIEEIISVSDAIMVARGDLAVEISAEEVPLIQKTIIKKAIDAGKPVITATHMLDSMVSSSVATRAEVNDVANAILDGTDAIMLSAETSIGKYPALSIETMARIALKTEESPLFSEEVAKFKRVSRGVADSVSAAVVSTAENIGAKCIVALSGHGFTPRMISRYKPSQPILVLTTSPATQRGLLLSYGCIPEMIEQPKSLDDAIDIAKKKLVELKLLSSGDSFVLSAGLPFGGTAGTNLLLVQDI
ncbi:MAG: pyruvate kinase [Candidatus Paceibacterota bacterium]|jgi:pyruvate kinase